MNTDKQTLDQRTNEILSRSRSKKPFSFRRIRGPRVRTSRVALLYLFISGMLAGAVLSGHNTAIAPFILVLSLFFWVYLE